MADLALGGGLVATVDDDDLRVVGHLRWHAQHTATTHYARRTELRGDRKVTIYLHRLLLEAPAGLSVDHIDRNGLNNRRANLRLVTAAQNLWNTERTEEAAPRWCPRTQKWRVTINHEGRTIDIGRWRDRDRAALALSFVSAALRGTPKPTEAFDVLELPPTARRLVGPGIGSLDVRALSFAGGARG